MPNSYVLNLNLDLSPPSWKRIESRNSSEAEIVMHVLNTLLLKTFAICNTLIPLNCHTCEVKIVYKLCNLINLQMTALQLLGK